MSMNNTTCGSSLTSCNVLLIPSKILFLNKFIDNFNLESIGNFSKTLCSLFSSKPKMLIHKLVKYCCKISILYRLCISQDSHEE